ncbi:amidohydrolase [Clostridium sp. AF17-2]|jgi:omega-amidase|uniref:nitrilase-related carbon-nitrogen hydrolase n=1 Tax=unclassified Clostridium TaxID=2614128 RepID=UPI000E4ED85A|nr:MULTISPECIES: nitrilase-related carbon-nitrogen hydrolase [unclassified Clostridium]RGG76539.1 amidohydrolase [Clostridium sp. AF17-21AC]RHR56510.1 amidohydrolase [Clostridium sp. AF17-2]
MLRVGVTELDIGFENREEAKKCCLEVMEEASANGVELLVFPEMTLTGFTMRPWLYAESWDADNIPDSVSFFMENSRKYKMQMAFGYIRAVMADSDKMDDETKEPVYENRLVLVDGENVLLDYAKIHPFSYSGEDKVYRAGEKLVQAQVKDIRIGGYICYDLRFPEIFSAMRDQYEVIMVIANWPETRAEQWETLLKARAIENQAYVIAVNRVGDGDGLHYIPGSHVYDWLGRDVSIRVSEKLRVADIDPGAVRHARTEFPQTNDRKNTFYKMIY